MRGVGRRELVDRLLRNVAKLRVAHTKCAVPIHYSYGVIVENNVSLVSAWSG